MIKKIRYRLVWNKARRLNKRNESLIQIECQQDGKRVYFSTHQYCRMEEWGNGSIVNHPNADSLNYMLYQMIYDIENIELEYIKRGINVTLNLLKDAVISNVSPAARLVDFGRQVIGESDRRNATKQNYTTLFNNLERYKRNLLLTDIDYHFVTQYEKAMKDGGVSHNTIISRLRMLSALMNEAKRRDLISTNPFEKFKIQSMVSKKGYITYEQLHKIEKMKLCGKEDKVRDAFLVGCYTGLRFSDIVSLRQSNIDNGWLTKKMVKTGFVVEIPVNELYGGAFIEILRKYGNDIGNLTKTLYCNAKVNKILRDILDRIGVDRKITFHSSRHTFATLLIQKGVAITTIQKMLGHTKITTTQIYSEVDKKTISNDLKRLRK